MAFRKTTTATLIAAALVAAATFTTTTPAAAAPMPTGGEELPYSPVDLAAAIKSCSTLSTACKKQAAAGEDPEQTLVTCDYCSEACIEASQIAEQIGRPGEAPQWSAAAFACVELIPVLPDEVGMPEASASDEPLLA